MKNNEKLKFQARKIGLAFIGTFIVALGIHLVVLSRLGADALSTFILGVLNHNSIQFGTVSLLINLGILLIVFFKKRELIGIASIINSFGIGLFLNLLALFPTETATFVERLILLVVGTELFAFGTALYLVAKDGSGAYECLMFLVSDWTGKSLRSARILTDGLCMVVGVLLGAPLNIGTVFIVFVLGPSMQVYLRALQKMSRTSFER